MKGKFFILTMLLQIILFQSAISQNLFQKRFGGNGEESFPKIVLTEDNGHLIYYRSTTNTYGDYDFALAKVDAEGDVEWTKHYGDSKRNLTRELIPFGDDYLAVGWQNQYSLIDDMFFMTIDGNGNMNSKKYWGLSDDDEVQSVVQLNNGDYALAGDSRSYYINGLAEIIYSTFDTELNMGTIHVYSTDGVDVPRKIIQGTNSNLFIVGYIRLSGINKGFVMSISLSGELIWAKKINYASFLWDMVQLSDNDFICVGEIDNPNSGGTDAFITKFDSAGNCLWARAVSFGESSNSTIVQIKESFNENYIVVGTTNGTESGSKDVFFMEIDAGGNFISGYTYGGDADEDWPAFDYSTADSGFTIVAETQSFDAENFDIFLINTDNSGNSCCAIPIKNVDVQNIEVNPQPINFSTATTHFSEQSHSFSAGEIIYEEELLCYEPVHIIGRDTIFCDDASNEKYTTDIDFLLDLNWLVPPTATLVNNESDTTIYINFNGESGMIYLLSEACADTLDSLYVYVESTINLSLGNDTLVCGGQPFFIYAGSGYDNYLWQDGSTDSVFLAEQTGDYWVRVENSCGFAYDTIHIDFSASFDIDLGADTSFCYGHTILLSPGSEYYAYYWQDGSADSLMLAGLSGYYWVQVTDSLGCTAIDSVYIEAYMDFGFSIGPDTSVICDGDYLFLHGPNGYQSYEWQDGSDYPDFVADTAGIYWLEITDENLCAARDSMLLIVNKIPDDFLGNDTVMCDGDYYPIHAPAFYDKYVWQDGSSDSVFIAWQTGDYWVYVEDSIGCSGIDTITLSLFQPPQLNHSNDTSICPSESIILSPGTGWPSYLWNTGSTDSAILVSKKGQYWVETGTQCGMFTDSVYVDIYFNPNFTLGADTNICEDETTKLTPGSDFYSYLWNDGSTESILIVQEEGIYWVEASDGRCFLSDSIIVASCSLLWIPNVFTPNSDGYNDEFYAVGAYVIDFEMVIFNRWGQIMKTLNNIEEKWDGRYNGKACADGVYYYVASYTEIGRSSISLTKEVRGAVTLIGGGK